MRARIDTLGLVALLAMAGTAPAQPSAETFTLPPTTLPAPAAPAADTDALRAIIREELKAEQQKGAGAAGTKLDLRTFVRDGFVAETADQAFRFHFGGRFDYDNAWFTQDDNLL